MGALRAALRVPAQRTDDGVDLVLTEPVDQLGLAVGVGLGALDGLDRGGDDLTGGPGVGLVLAGRLTVLLLVELHELLVLGVVRLRGVAGRRDDALGLVADRLRELGLGRRGREGGQLRLIAELLQRDDQVDAVLVLAAAHHDVGLAVGDLGRDAAEVGGVGRVDLVHDGLHATLLERVLELVGGALGERVVHRGVRRGLGPLALGHRQDVLGEELVVVVRDGRGGVEEVLEALLEDLGRRAGRLDEEVAVVLGDLGRRDHQAGGEGTDDQVDLLLVDQLLVVGGDTLGARLVVQHLEAYVAAEQAAVGVDVLGPGLVTALDALAGLAEVAGEGQRDADHDLVVAAPFLGGATGGEGGGESHCRRGGQYCSGPLARGGGLREGHLRFSSTKALT